MTAPDPAPAPGSGQTALRVIAALIGAIALVVFLLAASLVLGSRFGPPSRDMHGYGLIIGTALALPSGVLAATILPLAFRGRRRTIAYRIALVALVASLALLIGSVLTA